MTDGLGAFLGAHAVRPWKWGAVDCSLVLADWAVACGHRDPAPEWRGAYVDELGWKRIVADRGGLLPIVGDVCCRAGFRRTEAPSRGVIGVIGAFGKSERQWGAIHDGARWLVRNTDGFVAMTAHVLDAWVV